MSVFVCGSLHYDVVVNAPHLPRLDETVAGGAVNYVMGGKGGNQAVAAARMGARAHFSGRVGDDAPGTVLLEALQSAGVETSGLQRGPGASGMSVAIVEPAGGYGAVIVSAANSRIEPDRIALPDDVTVVLLQNEVPETVNLATARLAREAGVKVVLNAAPAREVSAGLLARVDTLVVNQVEAADMLGKNENTLEPLSAARALTALGPPTVILTLGGNGVVLAEGDTATHLPACDVKVVSTHGAGDTFLGAVAAAWDTGAQLLQAVNFGQAAAALHVSAALEQRSGITAADVEALMHRLPSQTRDSTTP